MTAKGPTASVLTDEAIMQALAQGEIEPLGTLYERYGQRVRSMLYRLHRDIAVNEVEDLCHETFIQVHRSAARYEHRGNLYAWICGVAIRSARNWRRKRWVRQRLLGKYRQAKEQSMPPAMTGNRATSRLELETALDALNQGQRDVLLMHAVEGLDADQIAAALGISTNTVWTRLHRARKAMRAAMRGEP